MIVASGWRLFVPAGTDGTAVNFPFQNDASPLKLETQMRPPSSSKSD